MKTKELYLTARRTNGIQPAWSVLVLEYCDNGH